MPAVTLKPYILSTVADPAFIGRAIRQASEQALRRKLLRNYCVVVSCAYSIVLDAFSVKHTMMVGQYRSKDHVWVEAPEAPGNPHDWQIYDLTLTQFDQRADPVSILPLNDNRYRRYHTTSKGVARLHLEVLGTAHLVGKIVERVHLIMAAQLTSGSVRST